VAPLAHSPHDGEALAEHGYVIQGSARDLLAECVEKAEALSEAGKQEHQREAA
jgi:hypothetical protein